MLRVDQAGEYGAMRIYAGQTAVVGSRHRVSRVIRHMAAQEQVHLEAFDRMLVARGVRPTLLHPLWHVAGYALGAATAIIGPRAAMACTAAVETEIDRHYEAQRRALGDSDPEFAACVSEFQADERAHRALAIESEAERAFAYPLLSAAIRLGCRLAIGLTRRL